MAGRHVIDEGGGAQAQVPHLGAGIDQAAKDCVVERRRGKTHVASQQHPAGVQQFGEEIRHLVGQVGRQVRPEVAADVIGMKSFEFHDVYFLSVFTR